MICCTVVAIAMLCSAMLSLIHCYFIIMLSSLCYAAICYSVLSLLLCYVVGAMLTLLCCSCSIPILSFEYAVISTLCCAGLSLLCNVILCNVMLFCHCHAILPFAMLCYAMLLFLRYAVMDCHCYTTLSFTV